MNTNHDKGKLTVHVLAHTRSGLEAVVIGAKVTVESKDHTSKTGDTERGRDREREREREWHENVSDHGGSVQFHNLHERHYEVSAHFGNKVSGIQDIHIKAGDEKHLNVFIRELPLRVDFSDGASYSPIITMHRLDPNMTYILRVHSEEHLGDNVKAFLHAEGATLERLSQQRFDDEGHHARYYALSDLVPDSTMKLYSAIGTGPGESMRIGAAAPRLLMINKAAQPVSGDLNVSLRRTASRVTEDVPLWVAIRKSTDSLSFTRYLQFMEWVFCGRDNPGIPGDFSKVNRRALPFTDTDAYRNVKFATEAFVMANCGVHHAHEFGLMDQIFVTQELSIDLNGLSLAKLFKAYKDNPLHVLPYLAIIRAKLSDQDIKRFDIGDIDLSKFNSTDDVENRASACYGILRKKLENPCFLELIWSYWQEEGMLTQTMNAVTRRFQNVRGPLANDPLANTEIDPLRPLNNVLWGYVQDEQHRLSVVRRNYEYDHHYGLRLAGKAVKDIRTADSRSRFLEAFHTLLSIVSAFYKRDDDTTMVADGFPVLNALKEAHLILSQGAHNQFGDLPSTARIEMLMQQWILARPEFREYLPTRIMVAYPEPWMDRVDAMKKLQGWSDTSVLHFRNLGVFGEQVLLSIRYGAWAGVNDSWQAVNWARYWRAEIQGYVHAYRTVTGIDLSLDVANAKIDATMPSVHLVKRLADQRRSA